MPAMGRPAIFVIFALAAGLGMAAGCAPQAVPLETVSVTPQIRQMVMTRYQPAVKAELTTPASAQFTEDPVILARRDRASGRTEVTAEGELHAQNESGQMVRYLYRLAWMDAFGGNWKLTQKSVKPEGEQ